uniref:Tail tape measure protein n=1 Tax=Siphoviridae sp. ctGkF12 TaxID=2826224 RepID=A0A8S5M8C3_9CAUD|nr:MAG TPA: tail tape measure protein [Siphoviridae sp. ctGkF12]
MNNDNGSIDFEARLRLEKLEEGVKEMEKMLNDSMKSSQKETDKLQQSINNLAKGAMAFFTISKAYDFAQKIIAVRSQFQQLEIAFGTMLKSKEKANALMAQMTDLAAKTPFGLQEVSEGAKRLLAFQVPAQEVTETLRRMGDVAAGLGVPMGQLIHVYGQVKAQGKLMTNDLYQFMNAGIPIIAELSKVVGKSETEIKDMVSAGKIGFAEVQAVIKGMTDEGGLFYNLMAEQSKTLSGQLSNLEDNFANVLNEIGKATEGIASGAISSVSFLVENYQTLGKVIAGLIATYGAYKTAILVNSAIVAVNAEITKGWTIAQLAQYRGLLLLEKAQKLLNTTMLSNPYVLVTTAVMGLISAYVFLREATDADTEATKRHNELREEQANKIDEERNRINKLIATIQDETKSWNERNKAFLELQKTTNGVLDKYSSLNQVLREMSQVLKELNGRYETMNEGLSRDAVKNTENTIKQKEAQIERLKAEMKTTASRDHRVALQMDINDIKRSIEADKILRKKQLKVVVKNDVANYESSLSGKSIDQIQAEKKLITEAYNLRKKQAKEAVSNLSVSKIDSNNPYLKYDWEELGMYNEVTERQIKLKQQEKKQIHDKNELLKEQHELQTKIKSLQGKTKKDDNELAQIDSWQKRHDEVSKILESKFGVKKETSKAKTKSELPTFDYEKAAREEARREQDFLFQKEQDRINIMEDGAKKRLAIIQLDYDRQEEEIRRRTEDQMAAFIEQQKAQAEAEGKWKRGQAFNEDTPEINAHRAKLQTEEQQLLASNHDYMLYQQEQVYKELLEKYQTYTDQRKAIEEKYNADIAALQAKLGADAPQVKKAQDEKARELKKLDILYKKEGTAIAKLFENMRKKTVKEIRETIADAEKEIDQLASMLDMGDKDNVDYIQNLKQQLEQARDTADRGDTVFGKLGTSIKNLFKAKPNTAEWQEAFNGMLSSAQSITSEFGQLGQEFEKLGQSTGNESLKRIGQTMQTVSNTLNRTLSMAQTGGSIGGGWGAAIGAVVGLVTSGIEAQSKARMEHERKIQEITAAKLNQQSDYNRLLYEERMLHKENTSVFGKKEVAIALGYLKEYRQQWEGLQKDIKSGLTKERKDYLDQNRFRILNKNWFDNQSEFEQKASNLEKINIAIGSYTKGSLWWKKTETIWGGITSVYPELIKANGEFNAELAKSIIKNVEFGESGKQALQDIIDQYDRAQESQKKFEEYVQNTFGELGKDITNSVYTALQKGEDAFESFSKTIGNVMGKLGKQLMYELYVADIFKDLQAKVLQAGKNSKGDSKVFAEQSSKLVGDFGSAMKGKIGEMQQFLKDWNTMSSNIGFDFINEQRKAVEKGLSRMSQDSADELNGQFRLQTQLSAEMKNAMLQSVKEFTETHEFMKVSFAQQLKHLAGIEANTYKLHKIETDIANMKAGISEITTKGIKIRS